MVLAFSPERPGSTGDWLAGHLIADPLGWLMNGRAAVITFFVISGLVLGLALDREPGHRSIPSYFRFLWRRALRIYPAHVAALVLFVPFAWLTVFRQPLADPALFALSKEGVNPWLNGAAYGWFDPREWLRTAALATNYYNPVTWTLQVEMLAALLLPLFAAFSRPGRLGRDLLILALLVAATFLVDSAKRPDHLLLYLPAFYLGCMARTHGRRLAALLGRRRGGQACGLAVSCLLLLAPFIFIPLEKAIGLTTLGMSAAAFLLASLIAWGEGRRVDAVMLNPVARWAGRLSYSFYLWHALILFWCVRLLFVLVPPSGLVDLRFILLFATILVTFSAAFVVAWLSWRWIERPFVALGRRGGRTSARERPNAGPLIGDEQLRPVA
jgi:peptidoglycan/LPS O-acetylase OafA/YrhL